jgi:site-specific recombinase XerD
VVAAAVVRRVSGADASRVAQVYRLSLAAFRAFFVSQLGDPRVDQIHSGHVEEFMTWRALHRQHQGKWLERPLHNRTVQKDRTVLHSVFNFACRLHWREGNPVADTDAPKADERQPVILTEAQYTALLNVVADRPELRLYILAMGETGARCESEILWLRWEDVDFETGFLTIASGRDGHRTKSGKSRQVPMTLPLRAAFKEHFARFRFATYHGEPTPWVFHHDRDHRRARAGGRIGSLRYAFLAAAKAAKLPEGFRQHDLRHRRVTTWLAQGKGSALVQEAMGHSSLTVTERYKHLVPEHLRALVEDAPQHLTIMPKPRTQPA